MLYGFETWSLTLRKVRRLSVFEDLIRGEYLSRMNKNEKLRKLHNEEYHSFYRSRNMVRVNKSKKLRWVDHIDRIEEGRSIQNTGHIPLRSSRRRWEVNISIYLKEIGAIMRDLIRLRKGVIGE